MKRILSLIVACFMLVTVFSALAVTGVSAAEPTTYTLPMDWTTGIKSDNPNAALHSDEMGFNYAERTDGLWKFAFYTDVDAGTAYTADSAVSVADVKGTNNSGAGKGPSPYIETANNRWLFVGTTNYAKWYVNPTGRWTGTSIAGTNELDYMKFSHNVEGYVPAVVFVAPKDGTYSFSAPVTAATITGGATLTATVRKNGAILATFSPTSEGESKTLTGEVTLQAGEELAFVFSQDANNFVEYGAADSQPVQFNLGATVITEVSSTGSGSEGSGSEGSGSGDEGDEQPAIPGPWSLPMNWTSTDNFDANGWELAVKDYWKLTSFADLSDITTIRNGESSAPLGSGVNGQSPKSYLESAVNRAAASNIDVTGWDGWYMNYQNRWFASTLGNNRSVGISKGDNSTYMVITPMGTADTNNPTVVFTAPVDGKYDYSTIVTGAVFTDENGAAVAVTATVRVNGEVVDTFSPTATDPTKTLTGTVELEEGDLLMFAFELTTTGNDITDYTQIIKLGTTTVAKSTNTGSGEGTGNEGNTGSPDTGAISVIALVGVAVAAAATGKVVATKRRRNG